MSEAGSENEASSRRIQERVVEMLERDFLAAEMKIALLVCALDSYRYDSVLRPFPAVGLRDDGSKDVQKLTQLCNSMPKLASIILEGQGTYLSSDLNVSMQYSKYNKIWTNSTLGSKMSCVAVCEVLDHPDVKCTQNKNARNGDTNLSGRARAKNSEGGDVPERYYVVTNNELLRVKYLLVYVEKHRPKR
ncbi:Mono [ADP-ribose] polymerase PARP16 [Exaiptasia diaphana]|nr:Mono [ADP-ribose] polymerase PARP16 [Exaiptasia diaphana]